MPRRSKARTAAFKSVVGPSRRVSSRNASPGFFGLRGADGSLGSSSSPSVNPRISSPTIDASHSRGPPRSLVAAEDETTTNRLIIDLADSRLRENALAHLARRARGFQDLAIRLWFSFGTIAILLQEVLSVYPFLSQPSLTPIQSDRLCNVLTLLQCVASHQETRSLFAQACLPFYLVVLLNQIGELRCFERIRILTLGIIAALVQVPDPRVISLLLEAELIRPCLCAMQRGSEFSRTVATLIVKRLLLDDNGLQHVCQRPDLLLSVWQALGSVVASLSQLPSTPLLRDVIACYLCLFKNERSLGLRQSLPRSLIDGTLGYCCNDGHTRLLLQQLLDQTRLSPIAQKDPHKIQHGISTISTSIVLQRLLILIGSRIQCQTSLGMSFSHQKGISF
ncbi:uncharacterized protein LOC127247783 [Andrographis paniculata]|uniref:uncharacterized protein LOC127247783 n=1 Tax=Andrographis paniculata TaxID=175694 RepID=UPI0021E7BEB0|nr:uncharacterized protein LOC127247783 [Andrographis paniculata]XP_051125757.1 uncharacterized protein LOC127247783 [Andrographis paniculata]